jgi:hypothetical protein
MLQVVKQFKSFFCFELSWRNFTNFYRPFVSFGQIWCFATCRVLSHNLFMIITNIDFLSDMDMIFDWKFYPYLIENRTFWKDFHKRKLLYRSTMTSGGAIGQLFRPLTVTPQVPGLILGNTLGIFQSHFHCFPSN